MDTTTWRYPDLFQELVVRLAVVHPNWDIAEVGAIAEGMHDQIEGTLCFVDGPSMLRRFGLDLDREITDALINARKETCSDFYASQLTKRLRALNAEVETP